LSSVSVPLATVVRPSDWQRLAEGSGGVCAGYGCKVAPVPAVRAFPAGGLQAMVSSCPPPAVWLTASGSCESCCLMVGRAGRVGTRNGLAARNRMGVTTRL